MLDPPCPNLTADGACLRNGGGGRPHEDFCRHTCHYYQLRVLKRPEMQPAPIVDYGLGSIAKRGIDATTFGMGKRAATVIARIFGRKNCGCLARAKCLNQLVPDVRKIKGKRWLKLLPQIMACLGVSDRGAT